MLTIIHLLIFLLYMLYCLILRLSFLFSFISTFVPISENKHKLSKGLHYDFIEYSRYELVKRSDFDANHRASARKLILL